MGRRDNHKITLPKWDGHLAPYDRLEACSTKGEGIIGGISNKFVEI